MSFHSTQATSHALHPMQVVVSMSLHTLSCRCVPSPATGPGWAEICWIRNVPRSPISSLPLDFLQLHQESFEFRCVGIRINDSWRQQIGWCLGGPAFGLGNPQEAPMDRHPDLVGLLAIHHHGLDALGDHRLRNVIATGTGDLYLV